MELTTEQFEDCLENLNYWLRPEYQSPCGCGFDQTLGMDWLFRLENDRYYEIPAHKCRLGRPMIVDVY
jgi:hypothetical protein